jgi:hypothetical protein
VEGIFVEEVGGSKKKPREEREREMVRDPR